MVNARVLSLKESRETVIIRGSTVDMRECYIADNTGKIRLQLWQDQISGRAVGCSYTVTNLAARKAGSVYLTCARATTVLNVDDITVCQEMWSLPESWHDALHRFEGSVSAVH